LLQRDVDFKKSNADDDAQFKLAAYCDKLKILCFFKILCFGKNNRSFKNTTEIHLVSASVIMCVITLILDKRMLT